MERASNGTVVFYRFRLFPISEQQRPAVGRPVFRSL